MASDVIVCQLQGINEFERRVGGGVRQLVLDGFIYIPQCLTVWDDWLASHLPLRAFAVLNFRRKPPK